MDHLLSERVKEIMEDLGYSPSSFADTIDVPRPIISHILSGRNKPSLDVIQKILLRFSELNPWWLLTGTGTMKQLNLFTDQELESISVKNTSVQQSNTTAQPVKATPVDQPPKPITVTRIVEEPEPIAPVAPTPVNPIQQHEKQAVTAPIAAQAIASGKTVEKMVIFYTDKTFSVYTPE